MAKVAREDIIKELEQLPDEMIPEIANILHLLKKKHGKYSKDKEPTIKNLIDGHKKARKLSATSNISWSEKIKENRADRI
ncbi:MAG TPA: hypothetical protein ENG83_07035 [Nitrospirae bacterium]|nr:hypothetical protein [Nitrospirota bacterium]HDZ00126.1 hypothetical protein [Nitrospirota bacterium]